MKKNGAKSNQTIDRMKVMGYQGNTIQAAKKKYDSIFNFYKYTIPVKNILNKVYLLKNAKKNNVKNSTI